MASRDQPNGHENSVDFRGRAKRAAWHLVWLFLYAPSPVVLHGWRRFLLRTFGADIHPTAHPYPSARIWAPWNLAMGEYSCLSHFVDCYCVAKVCLGDFCTVSQYSILCTATRDYRSRRNSLIALPITLGNQVWIAADAFIGPGVNIGDGAVIGVRSLVLKDVPPWEVHVGSPAQYLRPRELA